MSLDPRDELLALLQDARALLDDARLRGVPGELPATAPAPAAVRPPPSAVRPAEVVAKPAPARVEAPRETLEAVRADLGDCTRCGLCSGRKNIVFGVGTPQADLVVVGEGPGHDEDLKGEPFVGPAGQMLDKMLENVLGLPRSSVYIANVVKCRPPGNRNPLPDEVAACRPFLERQILAIRPKVILVLGSVALKALLETDGGIMKHRGRWTSWRDIPVMPTFHPAYLLRNPDDKRKTFEDLKILKTMYDERGGRRP